MIMCKHKIILLKLTDIILFSGKDADWMFTHYDPKMSSIQIRVFGCVFI